MQRVLRGISDKSAKPIAGWSIMEALEEGEPEGNMIQRGRCHSHCDLVQLPGPLAAST